MPKKKVFEHCTLVVVLKGRGSVWREILDSQHSAADHLALLDAEDLKPQTRTREFGESEPASNLEVFLSSIFRPVTELIVIGSNGTVRQLETILESVATKLAPIEWVAVGGFRLSGEQFGRLTQQFDGVPLERCHLGAGWWRTSLSRKCTTITLNSCTGAIPPKNSPGRAGWPALQSIFLFGPYSPHALRRGGRYPEIPPLQVDPEPFAREFLVGLWTEGLEQVFVNDLNSIDFITKLPPRDSLSALLLRAPVTEMVFEWILRHHNLHSLDLSWTPDVSLPWAQLKRLRKLQYLSVEETPFNDQHLSEIATRCKLRCVSAYYTDLTPAAWPTILRWKSLTQFWGSTELSGSEIPKDLPETTSLRRFVALNARPKWFRELLSRYPNVVVEET